MWRGTTPMHIFTLPVGVKLTDFSAVFIDTFDDRLWIAVIDHATVFHDGRIVFTFVNGMEVEG